MLDHLVAWQQRDIDTACKIWNNGLSQLQDYIADMGRLHLRYQTATWLRGLIPSPFMRPPMPRPRQIEIDTIYGLLENMGLSVIDKSDAAIDRSGRVVSA
jgi:4-hydroxy-tetrahydrodipicolinate synthase